MSEVTGHDLREVQRDVYEVGRELRATIRDNFDEYWSWKSETVDRLSELEERVIAAATIDALRSLADLTGAEVESLGRMLRSLDERLTAIEAALSALSERSDATARTEE